eukprot:159482_1
MVTDTISVNVVMKDVISVNVMMAGVTNTIMKAAGNREVNVVKTTEIRVVNVTTDVNVNTDILDVNSKNDHRAKKRKISGEKQSEQQHGDKKNESVSITPRNYEDLMELLECPICSIPMVDGPILQCSEGHTICQTCKGKLPNPKLCPQCQAELGYCRNRVLESMVEKIPIPCKNKDFGCLLIIPPCDRITHAAQCKFTPFECPHNYSREKSE